MPELPEVERMRRTAAALSGRVGFQWNDSRFRPAGCPEHAVFLSAGRRGKQLLLGFDAGTLRIEPRMTGVLRPESSVVGEAATPRDPRLRIHCEHGLTVRFDDPRRLARAAFHPGLCPDEVSASLRLGPEPWPAVLSGDQLRSRLDGAVVLKDALLEPRRVAGVGNIGVSEACFTARIDPHRPVRGLDQRAATRLAAALWTWVDDTLRTLDPAMELWSASRHEHPPFRVYGRDGQPCLRCGSPIERRARKGRGTWWCPACVL